MIAASASAFIQENLVSLSPLPTEEELERLREARRIEARRRVEEERRQLELQAAARRLREESTPTDTPSARVVAAEVKFTPNGSEGSIVVPDVGWNPEQRKLPTSRGGLGKSDDPMLQQMDIIRGYIRQARDARRFDELHMLEDNLRLLQQEYWAQHERDKSNRS